MADGGGVRRVYLPNTRREHEALVSRSRHRAPTARHRAVALWSRGATCDRPASRPMFGARGLSSVRRLLKVGAAPHVDAFGEECASRAHANPAGLSRAVELLKAGPAAAVDNVEELYAAGLPVGLPGGLSTLAVSQREELMGRVMQQRILRAELIAARSTAAASSAKQAALRKAGEFDHGRSKSSGKSKKRAAKDHAGRGGTARGAGGAGRSSAPSWTATGRPPCKEGP